MAERESVYLWETTAANNNDADPSINFAEGQLPGTLNNSNRGVLAAHARYVKDTGGGLPTAGSSNTYTLGIWGTQTAYATGHMLSFRANHTNTGAATLNVSNADAAAIGAKAIRGPGDVALVAGQIVANGQYIVQYNAAANSAAGAWMLLNPSGGISVVRSQRFTSSGTYTPHANMVYCEQRCRGGGGGGGGATSSAASRIGCGAGGGQGSLAITISSRATIGASQTVTIGAGGAGGTAGNNAGSAGGDTSIGSLCTGKGGSGGGGGPSFSIAAGGAGGVAGTGDTVEVGAPGGLGAGTDTSLNIQVPSAGGGYGGGAALATFTTTTGNAGVANSGGGGGGGVAANSGNAAGGAGGSGEAFIIEYCSS